MKSPENSSAHPLKCFIRPLNSPTPVWLQLFAPITAVWQAIVWHWSCQAIFVKIFSLLNQSWDIELTPPLPPSPSPHVYFWCYKIEWEYHCTNYRARQFCGPTVNNCSFFQFQFHIYEEIFLPVNIAACDPFLLSPGPSSEWIAAKKSFCFPCIAHILANPACATRPFINAFFVSTTAFYDCHQLVTSGG